MEADVIDFAKAELAERFGLSLVIDRRRSFGRTERKEAPVEGSEYPNKYLLVGARSFFERSLAYSQRFRHSGSCSALNELPNSDKQLVEVQRLRDMPGEACLQSAVDI